MVLTKKQYDVLLYLRKKPRKLESIRKKFKPKNDHDLNYVCLPTHGDLYERIEDKKGREVIKLTDEGVTYAQAEFDRRFDMYFTRVCALAALIISALTLFIGQIKG